MARGREIETARGTEIDRDGAVFDRVAAAYERHRPTYPDALVDHACGAAGLGPGTLVLEVGCGTGQLTRSLLARDLRVVALEPGEHLIARARDRLAGAGDVRFVHADLESASLPPARFAAVFIASAIHWIDPDVGWRKIAATLAPGGTLALISYFGRSDPETSADQQALREGLARAAPAAAAHWPTDRTLEEMHEGVATRRGNISEAWAWLGEYAVARPAAADLFADARLTAFPLVAEHSAQEMDAVLGTMSFWAHLSARQRRAVRAENEAVYRRLGRPIRSSLAACLMTAQLAA